MILAVCLNPAVDVTYTIDALAVGHSHRVGAVIRRAGGKGVNVARVLKALEQDAMLIGLAGEVGSAVFVPELSAQGISSEFIHTDGETRQTVTVVDAQSATVFNEAGPLVTALEWSRFRALFAARVGSAKVVALSGSLPPGVPSSAYADLTEIAHRAGATVIVDADGAALREALAAGPDVIKPNAAEAGEFLGRPLRSASDARAAAQALRGHGAKAVIVSRGADGLVAAMDGATAYRVRVPEELTGNPTGAGDALVAVVARGLERRIPLPRVLRDAAAVSAAAVGVPHAGEFDRRVAARLQPLIKVEEF